jgi:hypothetical protein
MSLLKRFAFDCPNCDNTFHRTLAPESKPQLLLECPFCNAEYEVEFDPERTTIITVAKQIKKD